MRTLSSLRHTPSITTICRVTAVMLAAVITACGGGGDPIVARCVISGVSVSPASATLVVGNSQTLGATAASQDCSSLPTTTWSSNATNIATVSSSGSVTAVAPGTAIVTATIGSSNGSAVITVTPPSVASIVVTPPSASVQIGSSLTLVAQPRDAQGNALTGRALAWQSLAPAVVSVSTSGVVTGVGTGSGVVTVTSESITQNVNVTVTTQVATVTLSPNNIILEPAPNTTNVAQQLTPTIRNAGGGILSGRTVSYVSSNTAVATVNAGGLVTAVSVGSAFITATSEGVSSAALPVTVARAFVVIDANQPTVATYTPLFINSSGASVSITRTSVGLYSVTIDGIGTGASLVGGNFAALVNAKSGNTNAALTTPFAICNSVNLDVTGPTTLTVRCEDAITGIVKDAAFRALVLGNNSVGAGGVASFSVHNVFSNTTYVPNAFFAWNTAGAPMTVTHGFNSPTFGGTLARHTQGVSFPFQYALVSPYSSQPGVACEVQNQLSNSQNSDIVCFDRTGPVNAIHSVVRLNTGRPGRNAGVAFVNGVNGAFTGQGFNSANGAIMSTRTGVGRYTVVFGGMVSTDPMGVMVSPWGTSGWVFCSHFYTNTNPVTVDVACTNQTGAFTDNLSSFTVLVLQ